MLATAAKVVTAICLVALTGMVGFYFHKTYKPDLVSYFDVSEATIAKDLEGRTAPLPFGQVWPFEPDQGLIAKVVAKKQVDDYVIVVADIQANAEVSPQDAGKPRPPGIKSVRVGLKGLAKLTYERINQDWYLVGVDSVSLRASPLVEKTKNAH